LELVRIHPEDVTVLNKDYYPLVNKLIELDQLNSLKGWVNLDSFLKGEFQVHESVIKNEDELQEILNKSSVLNWTNKLEFGMEIYSKENCVKAQDISVDLVKEIQTKQDKKEKINCIKNAVIKFNELNKHLDQAFIETGEREDLCEIFDNIADAVSIDVNEFDNDITLEWREW